MATGKTVPGRCSHCDAVFEVAPEAIGMAMECPHCHEETVVQLAVTTTLEDGASRKMVMWTVVGILFLVVALVAAIFAVHLGKKLMEEKKAKERAGIRNIQIPSTKLQIPEKLQSPSFKGNGAGSIHG